MTYLRCSADRMDGESAQNWANRLLDDEDLSSDWNRLMDYLRGTTLAMVEKLEVIRAIHLRLGAESAKAAATWIIP